MNILVCIGICVLALAAVGLLWAFCAAETAPVVDESPGALFSALFEEQWP